MLDSTEPTTPPPTDDAGPQFFWHRLVITFDPETAAQLTELATRNYRTVRSEGKRLLVEAVRRAYAELPAQERRP